MGICQHVSIVENPGWSMFLYRTQKVYRLVSQKHQMSNEKNPSCLGYRGDYTTQLYGDYNKPIQGSRS